MRKGQLTRLVCNALDGAVEITRRTPQEATHLTTGRRGEDEAHFYLRQLGYIVVARNWRTARRKGEIDIVAWDGDTLCFVEVKTRSSREIKPAEAAVDREKRRELTAMAREYTRRIKPGTSVRFDIVSVYLEPEQRIAVELFKNAYSWRSMRGGSRRS